MRRKEGNQKGEEEKEMNEEESEEESTISKRYSRQKRWGRIRGIQAVEIQGKD